MRLLITGASGFLGRHLVAELGVHGAEVHALGLEGEGLPAGVDFHAVDICDREELTATVEAVNPEAVVHLAALSHVGESWQRADRYYEVNVVGTANVLAAARGRRFLFSSSAEVYGAVAASQQPIAESQPPAPRSPYALTKAFAEREVLAAGGIVVRCFNLIGPGQVPRFAVPSFAAQLAAIVRSGSEPVLRVGNLAARRDFVHVADASSAFRLLLERGTAGGVYNVASGTALSIAEVLDRLIEIAGVPARIETDPERMRPIDVPLLTGDSSRLGDLGWSPARDVNRALLEIWRETTEAHS